MARARAVELFFDNLVLRQPGEEFELDPETHAPGDAFEWLDPEAQRISEEAYDKRRAAKREGTVRAELEAKIRAAAEKRLLDEVEAKVMAELGEEKV